MTVNDVFDFLAVRLNGPNAVGKTITLNFDFVDVEERYALTLENAVLNVTANKHVEGPTRHSHSPSRPGRTLRSA